MDKRRIVIVGGVAGGASAATRARRMNESAEIVLFEKDEHVSFANCGLPYHIGGEIEKRSKLLVATAEFLRKRFKIDVRVKHRVTSIDRENKRVMVEDLQTGTVHAVEYDKLILSPGARAALPSIEGVMAKNVLTLRNLEDMDRIKAIVDSGSAQHAVVVGSGFIGLEMIEQLVTRGLNTTLIERSSSVMPMLDSEMSDPIRAELERNGVAIRFKSTLEKLELNQDGLAETAVLSDGSRIEADLIIIGIGVQSNSELASDAGLELGESGAIATNAYMQTRDPDIYAVGDAAEYTYGPTESPARVAMAGPANRSGRLAGQHAATDHSDKMQPVQGTAIVRVFGLTAGVTGLTARTAKKHGISVRHATVVSKNHAGYYPNAQPMTLKLTYSPTSGQILGCQVVGGEGCDKRLDVVSTAMHFSGNVRQLGGLDLAYAPPFGAAKDPVHLAAFVATNDLDGIESFCEAGADLSSRSVLDVRTAAEVESNPLVGPTERLVHIPVDELRDRISELGEPDPKVVWVVTCAVGIRGHLACRILTQKGHKVENLSGGVTVRKRAWRE